MRILQAIRLALNILGDGMGKVPKRGRNIVIKTQFNINGSRGKNVGHFISDYVARDAATDASLCYLPPVDRPMKVGDGVAFTMDATAISKQETLDLADHVQSLFAQGNRAIEQLVISFAPEYLIQQGIVPEGIPILERGAYKYNYDDVRLRHSVMAGMHAMLENDGYYNGNMVAAIQSDTMHLHVHAVVYEDGNQFTRFHGREERGMLKESSLNRLSHGIDRYMETTKDLSVVPTQRFLTPEWLDDGKRIVISEQPVQTEFVDRYLLLIQQKEREAALRKALNEKTLQELQRQMDQEIMDW